MANFVGTLPAGGKGLNRPGTIAPPSVFTYDILTGIASTNEPVKFSLGQKLSEPV